MRECRDAFVSTISTFYIALFSEKVYLVAFFTKWRYIIGCASLRGKLWKLVKNSWKRQLRSSACLVYADCPKRICDILNIDDGVVSILWKFENFKKQKNSAVCRSVISWAWMTGALCILEINSSTRFEELCHLKIAQD